MQSLTATIIDNISHSQYTHLLSPNPYIIPVVMPFSSSFAFGSLLFPICTFVLALCAILGATGRLGSSIGLCGGWPALYKANAMSQVSFSLNSLSGGL